jgi:hypothetical protein
MRTTRRNAELLLPPSSETNRIFVWDGFLRGKEFLIMGRDSSFHAAFRSLLVAITVKQRSGFDFWYKTGITARI